MKESIIFGAIIIAFGIFLITLQTIVAFIYGIIAVAVGIALIIFNKEENKIEQRKDLNKKGA